MSDPNLPAGGASRAYYEENYGSVDEGPDIDAELNLESLYETARPSDEACIARERCSE